MITESPIKREISKKPRKESSTHKIEIRYPNVIRDRTELLNAFKLGLHQLGWYIGMASDGDKYDGPIIQKLSNVLHDTK